MYGPKALHRINLGCLPVADVRVVLNNVRFSERSFLVYCFLNLPDEREFLADETDVCWCSTEAMYGFGGRRMARSESENLTWVIDLYSSLIEKCGHAGVREDILTLKVVDVEGKKGRHLFLEFGDFCVEMI